MGFTDEDAVALHDGERVDPELRVVKRLRKQDLMRNFASLVIEDRSSTARMLAYIGEIDRRKLYLEDAYPSMFAFCTQRFRMSEAVAAKRIRAGRTACRFPCILGMVRRGELHLSGIHQLAAHLTDENHEEVLRRAKHRTMREIEVLIARIAPMADAPSSVRTERRANPLSPGRYRLQVTIGQEARDALIELQGLLSHQVPNGDIALIVERALKTLVTMTKKQRTAATKRPRRKVALQKKDKPKRNRAIPAHVRRTVFERDEGRCAWVNPEGRRCGSTWQVELHHRIPYAKGGSHAVSNIELRCRAHNQHEAELEFGKEQMESHRRAS